MSGRGRPWLCRVATTPLAAFVVLVVGLAVGSSLAAHNSYTAQVAVHFSPHGGCTDAIVRELAAAQKQILLQAYRKSGVGSRLLEMLEAEAKRRAFAGIMLHAQLSAMEFYKRHGYEPHGAVFEEAGMPHLEMKRRL